MVDNKKALGRGLGSLIPMGTKTSEGGKAKVYYECPIEDVIPNPNQPRKLFAKEELAELSASIKEQGIIQPLLVRPIGGGKYELIAGERRYRASKMIGLQKVPVVIKEAGDSNVLELALIENIQRQDLNPVEEALGYKELLSRYQMTQDELAKKVGKDRSSIANSLRLLKLPDKIRDLLINNKISMGHARSLLSIDNKELQLQVADDIVKNNLSVREVEVLTKKLREHDVDKSEAMKATTAPVKEFKDLARQVEQNLRKKVAIKSKNGKGHLAIAFQSEDELNEIIDLLISS